MARFVLGCRHRLNKIIRCTFYKKGGEQLVFEVLLLLEDDCLFSLLDISPLDGIQNPISTSIAER